ncbi:MAG TPA: hypothetical protein VLO09_03110 [Ornithinimicrobium sp.]|nr:hypothetical protein [Ornithinimicrobium sp.]
MPEGWGRRLSSPWTLTLLSYGLSQAVVLAGSLVRIPLITQALGEVGYGRFIVITSVWPAIQILAHGLASTARVVVAEDPRRAPPTVRALRWTGTKEGAVVLVLAALLLPVLGPTIGWGFAWSVLWVGLAAVVVLPIAGHHGVLEGAGRTAASHLALATTTVVGLPVLVLALGLRQDLSTVVAASMVGFVAPYLTYRLLTRRLVRLREPDDGSGSGLDGVVLTGLSGAMTAWALSNVLVFLFDPVIIMATTGAAAAGQYGLASRITGLVTAVPIALGGLLIVWFSRARTQGQGALVLRRLVSSSAVFTVVGVALAVVTIALGPWIGQLLGRGAVGTPQELYTWLGIYGGLTCASSPLVAAWAAPRAAATRARLGVALGIVNVALSVLLAQLMGTVGPVVATVVCNGSVVLALALLTWRRPALVTRAGAGG